MNKKLIYAAIAAGASSLAKAYPDVTQSQIEGKALDRGQHIRAYIEELSSGVPLFETRNTLLSRILGTSGLHHNFWGDAEWARRVKASYAKHEAAKAANLKAVSEGLEGLAKLTEQQTDTERV